jgi:hypothetical protein
MRVRVIVDKSKFQSWLLRILKTQDEEISCSLCFDLISQYVDLENEGKEPGMEWEPLRHHLDQCLACRQDYEVLRDLTRLDAGEQ